MHGISHRIKKIAKKHGVILTFRMQHKLGNLCKFSRSSARTICGISHPEKTRFVDCARNVVYGIPLTCGALYVGQTERCLNHRLREHAGNVKRSSSNSNLADHVKAGGCSPSFADTKILHSGQKDLFGRLVLEALEIHRRSNTISEPSVQLPEAWLTYLNS